MRSTLFYIPHEIAGFQLFGFGIALAFLSCVFVAWHIWLWTKSTKREDLLAGLPMWILAAVVIVFVLPTVESRWPDGSPIGLPIRGYGIMVLFGLLLGIGISVRRGMQLGIHSDLIVGLGFWMMVGGVVGARLFFVVQKWETFSRPTIAQSLIEAVKVTEGGLVIYGGVIGGLLAGTIFCWKHKLNVLATADLVAPGFLIGLSLGRIGCLLHGCCFGGVCSANLPTIEFPQGSVPYISQVASGEMLGVRFQDPGFPAEVEYVQPGSPAAVIGIREGDRVRMIVPREVEMDSATRNVNARPEIVAEVVLRDGRVLTVFPSALPHQSLPVHPAQVYAAINALLLCLLIWHWQPIPKRDGIAFASAILLYAFSRFLLEGVRSDEGGQLGTGLSISQWIALGSGTVALFSLVVLNRRPMGRAWTWNNLSKSAN